MPKGDIILSSSHKSNIEDQDQNSKLRTPLQFYLEMKHAFILESLFISESYHYSTLYQAQNMQVT